MQFYRRVCLRVELNVDWKLLKRSPSTRRSLNGVVSRREVVATMVSSNGGIYEEVGSFTAIEGSGIEVVVEAFVGGIRNRRSYEYVSRDTRPFGVVVLRCVDK